MTVSLFSAPDEVKNGPENMLLNEIQTLTAQLCSVCRGIIGKSQFIGPNRFDYFSTAAHPASSENHKVSGFFCSQ